MTIEDAIRELKTAEEVYRRRIIPTKRVSVKGDYLVAGSEAYFLNDKETLRLVCAALHAPGDYIDKLPTRLRAELLQHHLGEGWLRDHVIVVTDGKQLVALDRADLLLLPSRDVLQAAIKGIGNIGAKDTELSVTNLRVEADRFTVDLVSASVGVEPRPGDVIRAGLRVTHSAIGRIATDVSAYIERLVCRNGAVSRTCVDRKQPRTRRLPGDHPNALRLQCEQIERLARSAWAGLQNKLGAIRHLTDTRFANEEAVIGQFRSLLRQNRLSTDQTKRPDSRGRNILSRLQAAWEAEGKEPTAYGVLNAFTRLGSHDSALTTRERFALTRIGGLLAFQRHHLCPRCFSLIAQELPPVDATLIGSSSPASRYLGHGDALLGQDQARQGSDPGLLVRG